MSTDTSKTTSVTFVHNAEGSVSIRLAKPVKVNGEEMSMATIPALKGKHMKVCPFGAGDGANVPFSKIVEFASIVVVPSGFVDELDPMDALAVGAEVAALMGKSRSTGGAASP